MLVLSRKVGETIVVPQLALTVTVLEVRGDRIRLGIKAPSGVPVHRREVWDRIRAEVHAEQKDTAQGAELTDNERD